jgi:hypothetical protein
MAAEELLELLALLPVPLVPPVPLVDPAMGDALAPANA